MLPTFNGPGGLIVATASRSTHGYAVWGEISKQLSVLALVAALGIWQHHFVIQAASADVYLFALLFGAGLFGMYNAVAGTHQLNNEFIALAAMKEVYEDAIRSQRDTNNALIAQFRRTQRPATVYHMPSALATAHNLIVEEVQRNGLFRISTTTMQVLVADLETKLDDRQGTTHYLGALMVLLGLLGTFIGLMHTLESVGGILGSLDLSGSAGAGAIAGLIESLKKPLDGMSTGFGASLFGLIGSLLIGFLGKLDSKASFRLKHEFETWIRSTVQIEDAQSVASRNATTPSESDVQTEPGAAEGLHTRTMLKVARLTIASTAKLAEQVAAMTAAIEGDRNDRNRQTSSLERIAETAERTLAAQLALNLRCSEIASSLVGVGTIVQETAGNLTGVVQTHTRSAAAMSAALLQEARLLHDTASLGLDGLHDMQAKTRQIQSGMQELSQTVMQARGEGQNQPNASEVSSLIAELDHLIAATHLGANEIRNLRRLSAIAEGLSGLPDELAAPHAMDERQAASSISNADQRAAS